MDKLRTTIAQYSSWQTLEIYIERMEGHLETDFSISVENAKALLESIGKEICDAKGVILGNTPSINAVLKKAFVALGYTTEELVAQMSGSLANIGQLIGNLRNEISPTSHGKSLNELKDRNNKVDLLTREFLIDSTLVVAVFLIRAFEERREVVIQPNDNSKDASLNYNDNDDFNSFWDESFGDFEMGEYSYSASEILFSVELEAYQTEFKAFLESDTDIAEGQE
ncbi:abortive infection family protein [Pseudomonas simiae]|uniref:abortive infection family protein n=1 Tax=Pseudomonas simiae TaxID=321846 RepID=UPI00159344F0|nr:abortive infection family protein [Pseudomonas simiae]NVH64535.1 abortive infection family protein [Pseudomonas simiae]